MDGLIDKGGLLADSALPYIRRFKGTVFVIKYGGNAMKSGTLKKSAMKDIALLSSVGINLAIVHGGGPNITSEMKKAGIEPKFVNGLRVTDQATLEIVERVCAEINDEIRAILKSDGIRSQNVKGTLIARAKDPARGFVGEVTRVRSDKISAVISAGQIPVLSPLGISEDGFSAYNINADTAAAKVAIALGAERLVLLTDVDGVLEGGKRIARLCVKDAHDKIASGVITGGMIPKVEACVEAVAAGCGKACLINGTVIHSLLSEIFTDAGIGTEIVRDES